VIAVPCAGVNFLITAFLLLTLRRLWRERFQNVSWSMIPVAAVLAYVATLIANTARIWLALELRARSVEVSGLTNNQLHRLEGIVVYFGFLLLLFVLVERFDSRRSLSLNASVPVELEPRTQLSLARLPAFPLLVYYAVTLGIPLANGGYRQGSTFWEHSIFVLVLPVLFVAPLAACYAWRRIHNRRLLPR
jgi:exosortase/archaeosortase family protein